MPSPTLIELVEAIYTTLAPLAAEVDGLQVYPYMNLNPTPPSIDIYPGDPFQAPSSMGHGRALFFTVRARANVADREAGQQVLLRLLDVNDPASVEEALTADGLGLDLDGAVAMPEGTPTGFRLYTDSPGELVGVEWRLEVLT